MIHTGRNLPPGAEIELRRGECTILARVMWREGGRAGLRSDERVPVEEIVTLGQSPAFQLIAASDQGRKSLRPEEIRRLRARAIEFAGVAIIAASLAGAMLMMAETAFARPLAFVAIALGH